MTTLRSTLIAAVILLGICNLCACKPGETRALVDGLNADPIPVGYADSSNKFANIIKELSAGNEVRWTDGYTGNKSSKAFTYEWFSQNAPGKALLELMNDPHPSMRAYAFLCLKDRRNINLKPIILEHLKDTLIFQEARGCIESKTWVMNEFCFEQCTGHFTDAEVKKYRKQIAEYNAGLTISRSR